MLSIVVPVYRNEENVDRLVQELERIAVLCPLPLEVVFVIDGSPDRSRDMLRHRLAAAPFTSVLASLSRNFGAFNAVRCGLELASGDYFTALPADLQEPADLALRFLDTLRRHEADIVFATRASRADAWSDRTSSNIFWSLYRRFVLAELPSGGVHTFGCTRKVRDRLLELREPTTNLIAQLMWLGFRRAYVPYDREARREGRSAWTLAKKLRYCFDSIFSFTDLPVRLLLMVGFVGTFGAVGVAALLLGAKLAGRIPVPGYAPTVLLMTFFGSITSLGLGIVGEYTWLILQASRGRPGFVIDTVETVPATVAVERVGMSRQ